jgi:chromosome transmission fidelity protein 8
MERSRAVNTYKQRVHALHNQMIIPVHLSTSDTSYSTLPSSLAVLGSSEVVLIELQGALEVEGDPTAGHIGTLDMNNAVKF